MNKKDKINESLDKMKRLYEFHFKSSGSQRDIPMAEKPVKFNEIDKYKKDSDTGYPDFNEYLDEVVLDEEEPEEKTKEPIQEPVQQDSSVAEPTPQSQQSAINTGQNSQPEPVASTPEQQAPQPEPAPVAPPAPAVGNNSSSMDTQNNELLSKLDILTQKLDMLDKIPEKIASLSKEVEEIKNPSLDNEMEMISKSSYPFNIKLSDYWDWEDKENQEPEEEREYTLSPEEIESYNKDDIKKSFNIGDKEY